MAHDKAPARLQSIRKVTTAESDFKTVDEYIAAQPETARVVLKRLRTTIRKASPGAEEVIPAKLIERIAKFRAEETARREKSKRALRKR